MRRCLT